MVKNNLKTSDDIIDELIDQKGDKIGDIEKEIKLLKLLKATIKRERNWNNYGIRGKEDAQR